MEGGDILPMSTQPPLNRTFLPVPLETTFRSYKHSNEPLTPPESSVSFDGINDFKHNSADQSEHIDSIDDASLPSPIRSLPQPIETSRRSHRVVESALQSEQSYGSFTSSIPSNATEFDRQEITQAQDDASTPKQVHSAEAQPSRSSANTLLKPLELVAMTRPRFTPQLMETTRRFRCGIPQYTGPVNNEAAPIPSDTIDTTISLTPKAAVVPHHKLTIWQPPEVQQAPPHRPQRPKARPLDGRSDLLTADASRGSSLPPPLRPYRQGSMRPHLNTRMNTRAGSNTDNSTPTGLPDIVVQGFGGDKQIVLDDEPWDTPYPSASSDRPRYDSYSSTPSLSGSYDSSSQSQSDTHWMNNHSNSQQHLARTREFCHERYPGYPLSLAAVEAAAQLSEKTLKEQVESSFPNRDFCHEPVSHWGPGDDESSRAGTQSSKDFSVTHVENEEEITLRLRALEADESDEESDDGFEGPPPLEHEMLGRKESAQAKHVVDLGNGLILGNSDLPQEAGMTLEQILAHETELVRLRAEETFRLVAEEATKPSFADPFWTNGTSKKVLGAAAALQTANKAEDKRKDHEMKVMLEAARPPLVGDDVVFRMCPSPKRTKNFDTNHKFAANIPKAANGGGLWGGYCVPDDRSEEEKRPRFLETPLETPFNECADYSGGQGFLPLTDRFVSNRCRPSHSRMTSGGVNILNEKLKAEVAKARREDKIQEEFNDMFVTQVYNYLSLGWPLLAREYDEELSHISHISEDELRSNDDDNAAVGNVGLQRVSWAESDENGSVDQAGQKANEHISNIPRWRALKRYIHEWARQHPDLEGEGQNHRNWGDEASRRKGSWAI